MAGVIERAIPIDGQGAHGGGLMQDHHATIRVGAHPPRDMGGEVALGGQLEGGILGDNGGPRGAVKCGDLGGAELRDPDVVFA